MESNAFNNINNKIYANNNNILLEIINELQQIKNCTKDDLIIKRLSDSIIKMNNLINDNKKNTELIIQYITNLESKMIKEFKQLNINNKQEKKYNDGDRYVGDLINGIREGKGTMYYNNGNKYEGEWKNGLKEGKGILYFKCGEKYEGEWKNDKKEGKGNTYYQSDDRY